MRNNKRNGIRGVVIGGYLIWETRVRTLVTRLASTINGLSKVTELNVIRTIVRVSLLISSIWGHRYITNDHIHL
jgi:hypothetical protein